MDNSSSVFGVFFFVITVFLSERVLFILNCPIHTLMGCATNTNLKHTKPQRI